MEAEKKLGEVIKFLREKKLNMTQKEFSEKLGITTVYASYLEKAKRPPSLDLLNQIYALLGEIVPEEIKLLLKEVKVNKKKESLNISPTDLIYDISNKNLYKYPLMKKKLKENPEDISLMYGIIRILIDEGKKEEAKKQLFKFLSKVKKIEDKKWLEASYYELEGNIPLAIRFLEEALNSLKKTTDNTIKAKLSYQLASMYFRQGQFHFRAENNKEATIYFKQALEKHEEIRKIYEDPFYQMDYASIFLWLALLNINPKENFEYYLKNAEYALTLNHKKGIENASFIEWKGLYNKQFIVSTISFMGRSYAHLADLEKDKEKKISLLYKGELLFSLSTPIEISAKFEEYYRFYFNQACFYSIKAKIFCFLNQDYESLLDSCTVNLNECSFADKTSTLNLLKKEVKSSLGLVFYREKRPKDLKNILESN